jgi:hypothetical protein
MQPEVKEWLEHLEELIYATIEAVIEDGNPVVNYKLAAAKKHYIDCMEGL